MNELSDLNLDNDSDNDEIESPVEGPPPDWMKAATSSGGSSFSEEDAPQWLKSIRAGKSAKPTPPQPPQQKESAEGMSDLERLLAEEGIDLNTVAEERPAGAENMSAKDWLIATSDDELVRKPLDREPVVEQPPVAQTEFDGLSEIERLLAEEGIDLSTVAEERPAGAENMSAKDWLISTSDDDLVRKRLDPETIDLAPTNIPVAKVESEDDKIVAVDDLPAWLQDSDDDEGMGQKPAVVAGATGYEDDKMVAMDDLPDWLQEADDDEPLVFAETTYQATTEPADDDGDKMVVTDDLPDWLKDVEEEDDDETLFGETEKVVTPQLSDNDTEDDMMVVADDLPDWLRESDEDDSVELTAAPVATTTSDDTFEDEEELPDWLQEVGGEDELIAPALAVSAETEDEDLPDWLRETEPDEFEVVSESPPQVEDEEEDLPDWLKEVEGDEEELPVETPVVATASVVAAVTEVEVEEEDLPDWLKEVEGDEEELPVETPVVATASVVAAVTEVEVEEEDLPDWLKEVEGDEEELPVETPVVATASVVAAVTEVEDEEEDLPDWLKEVEEDEEELPVEAPIAETVSVVAAITEVEDEEEDLPDWLKEVEEDEEELPVEAPIAETVSVVAAVTEVEDEEEDLPDWLKEVEAGEGEELPVTELGVEAVAEATTPPSLVVEEELPDWLQEVETEDALFEPSEPSPDPFADIAGDEEVLVEDELPDWLQEVQQEVEEEVPPAQIVALTESPSTSPMASAVEVAEDEVVSEEGLPDWLKAIEIEAESPDFDVSLAVEPEPLPLEARQDIVAAGDTDEAVSAPEVAETPAPVPSSTATAKRDMPDWLKKLREGGFAEQQKQPVTPPMPVPIVTPSRPQVVAALPQSTPLIIEPEPIPDDLPTDPAERLTLAQSARERGDINEALRIYESLVLSGAYLDTVIDDAREVSKSYPDMPRIFQLMGDAMVRDGRLQSALEAYRQAMAQLTVG